MCILRVNDYPKCHHKYILPLFCPRSVQKQRFCNNLVEHTYKYDNPCKHCHVVYTIAKPENHAQGGPEWVATMTETKKAKLSITCQNVQNYVEEEEGIAVGCLDENSNRGLGLPLTFNARYMLAPTTKGKNLRVQFSWEEDNTIGEDGGLEWKQPKATNCNLLQMPDGCRFIQMSAQQLWAWWRDRVSLTSEDDTFRTLNVFWGREEFLRGGVFETSEMVDVINAWLSTETPSTDPAVVESFDESHLDEDEKQVLARNTGAPSSILGTGKVLNLHQVDLPDIEFGENVFIGSLLEGSGICVRRIVTSTDDVITWFDEV